MRQLLESVSDEVVDGIPETGRPFLFDIALLFKIISSVTCKRKLFNLKYSPVQHCLGRTVVG